MAVARSPLVRGKTFRQVATSSNSGELADELTADPWEARECLQPRLFLASMPNLLKKFATIVPAALQPNGVGAGS